MLIPPNLALSPALTSEPALAALALAALPFAAARLADLLELAMEAACWRRTASERRREFLALPSLRRSGATITTASGELVVGDDEVIVITGAADGTICGAWRA